MNSKMLNNLVDWANEKNQQEFKEFILFINNVDEKKLNISISYDDKKEFGKIKTWLVFFNRRFPDFDFKIQVESQKYSITLKRLIMNSFKKLTDNKYQITNNEGKIFIIQYEDSVKYAMKKISLKIK